MDEGEKREGILLCGFRKLGNGSWTRRNVTAPVGASSVHARACPTRSLRGVARRAQALRPGRTRLETGGAL